MPEARADASRQLSLEEVEAYCSRIGFPLEKGMLPPPSVDLLTEITSRHAFAICFENLDVLQGKIPKVDIESCVEKIVSRGRGGYCFESNQLLFAALKAFGFSTQKVLARVLLEDEPSARTHLVNVVESDGKLYTCDCAFGAYSPRTPLLLSERRVQRSYSQVYRYMRDPKKVGRYFSPGDSDAWILQQWVSTGVGGVGENQKDSGGEDEPQGDWIDLLAFNFDVVFDVDIECYNHFVATSMNPTNIFTSSRVIAKKTPFGRASLNTTEFRESARLGDSVFVQLGERERAKGTEILQWRRLDVASIKGPTGRVGEYMGYTKENLLGLGWKSKAGDEEAAVLLVDFGKGEKSRTSADTPSHGRVLLANEMSPFSSKEGKEGIQATTQTPHADLSGEISKSSAFEKILKEKFGIDCAEESLSA
uniref:Uncharacterized protein n=1 Tax=Chromera velia CCMP2878 TaxID=1169474 RepID=A0A0G4HMU1_9ALVE|eukprot:Cvel_29206.t1-p1 / transcript=Cvel_29206.t1 / gene=Cvel_29206 / organism=Chromera_velia_CCMP2878 / gene_product=N-hydroxyarylamine O-acetyltransferase, putative / transcript_product=N-hydroxyarylamine O-acetyltransferase, putative / location=Cvel_scaffold3954:6535-8016(+) / protein_length=420 / sequence_SO=supercontig / SO=protein_coding / is_pseudo=false